MTDNVNETRSSISKAHDGKTGSCKLCKARDICQPKLVLEDKEQDGTCWYCEYYSLCINEHPCSQCYHDYDRPCFTPKEEE